MEEKEFKKFLKDYEESLNFIKENKKYSKLCNLNKKNRQYYNKSLEKLRRKLK